MHTAAEPIAAEGFTVDFIHEADAVRFGSNNQRMRELSFFFGGNPVSTDPYALIWV